ncbi:hypothetical protein pb186bvf_010047 [Paramecium bursaria]
MSLGIENNRFQQVAMVRRSQQSEQLIQLPNSLLQSIDPVNPKPRKQSEEYETPCNESSAIVVPVFAPRLLKTLTKKHKSL